jgi:molybdopterin/thiamine biosynthesis adenylyltransferase
MINYSRNWLFIEPSEQKALADLTVFIMGVGIGSVFAELALRTGIRKFILADGDTVDESNLNRQNYTQLDIEKSKAHACAARLRAIDPDVQIAVIDSYLDETSMREFIPQADVVINTIDFDSPAFPVAGRLCRQYRKMELFPMNLGFGSSVCVFLPESPTWETYYPGQDHVALKHSILMHIAGKSAHPYLHEAFARYQTGERKGYDPQLAVSSSISSTLMMGIILRKIKGKTIQAFPEFYHLDPFES